MKKLCLITFMLFAFVGSAHAAYTTDVYMDQGGDRIVIASGGTFLAESGSTMTLDNGVLAPADLTCADTYVFVGNGSAVGACVDMTGDVAITNAGVTAIQVGAVEDSMLEALAAGYFFIGVDGTAANNAMVTMSEDATIDGTGAVDVAATFTQNLRDRVTVAEIIAGHELLAAISGSRYRIISAKAIAYGGACGTTTTVDILGTVSAGSVKIVAYAQASLTQSTVLTDGGTGAAVLGDGASYVSMDANTAITIDQTGGDVDTCTGVDVLLTYVIE